MGFFKNRIDAVKQYVNSGAKFEKQQEVKIRFDEGYIQRCQEIMKAVKNGTWNGGNQISIDFDDDLLEEIDDCVESHSDSIRVLYSDEMQFLDVVGESFRQEELRGLYNQVGDVWLSGFLMPEPLNPHDPNAVSVMIIAPDKDNKDKFVVVQAGYLKKEQAKKVSKKIMRHVEQDEYIPILLTLVGGSPDKPNFGVVARAKTDAIKF
jgi:hypothetical protein